MTQDPRAADRTTFPDPVYKETVLRPLFDGAKAHHVEGFRAIDRAHLVMLAETGILPRDAAGRIARALAAIDTEIDPSKLVYTGAVEDYFFAIEAELRKRLGPDEAGRLHTGRSRNDIDHTLFKLALKPRLDRMAGQLRALIDAALRLAEREQRTLIVAYTHGQPAQPSTLGHYLGAAIEVMLRDHERLIQARELLDLSPMGAAAITTSGFPLDRDRVARLLGFKAPLENSYGCIAAVDYVTGAFSAVELVFLHLGRVIQDLQFWTAFEVGQIYVPNAFVQISSIMPQKRNPVPIEHLRHLASQAMGRARVIRDVIHNTPFTDMNDAEGETHEAGYQAFETGGRVLELLAALLPALQVDDRRVAETIRRSCITITELADTLVRGEGLSFRQAHEIAAEVARAVVAADGDLPRDGYAPFVDAFRRHAGREPGLDAAGFAEAVSPERFVAVRERFGGPGPQALAAALARYRARLGDMTAAAEAVARRERAARDELQAAFAALAGEA
ncbi:argininosuccinate lyase [Alsobacter soli]|uniref:Argininosuccinate lyase n=1 Tax=Alsobacter soli TaxID=2109933 RepID=A0A2T1HQ95_9HYPH|nr:argininosuccinate lyase [Alsobacter soli]PSC03825.1 argininosuccinate lyase [Alsobacter soli]